MSLILVACGPQRVPPGLVYCSEGNPESFNPQLVTSGTTIDATSQQIYSRLVDYDPQSGELVPALATSWDMSQDGLKYHFTLRSAVQFHRNEAFTPTRPFNVDDVLFSFNRIIDPHHPYHKISRTGYPFFQSIAFSSLIESIERVSDHQVTFHLKRKDAAFLSNLATDFAVILSAQYGEQLLKSGHPERLDLKAIGTGPFRLVEYVKNDYIRYRRHPDYWGAAPAIEMLVFDITTKSTTRLAKLITGDCNVSALPKAGELDFVRKHEEIKLESQPGLNVSFWAFNTKKTPFNDVRVRKALAYAIDKRNILRAVYQDTGVEAHGVLPPASWAYMANSQAQEYSPKKAKALLRQAGIQDLTIDIWAMPVARIYNPNALKTAELIQSDLANIGVRVNIISYDWSVFTQKLSRSNYDSVLIGWNADNSDPDNFFTPLLSCSSLDSGSNRSRWCFPAFDAMLNQARAISSKPQRKALYQSAEMILAQEMPLVSLAHAKRLVLKRKQVNTQHMAPFGGISFANMTLTQTEERQP